MFGQRQPGQSGGNKKSSAQKRTASKAIGQSHKAGRGNAETNAKKRKRNQK